MERPNVNIKTQCPRCKKVTIVTVPRDAYEQWQAGLVIQRAFAELPIDKREMLITGYCGKCFDEMFPPEEDDDDTCK